VAELKKNAEELATEISERVQSLHWGKCRCKGCSNMIRKRAVEILDVIQTPPKTTEEDSGKEELQVLNT
jgi:hypothetical protein